MARPRKDQQIDIRPVAIAQTMHLLDSRDAADITMSDVADAVGCRAPALYAYFAGRDALLRAVHDEGFRLMLEEKIAVATRNADDAVERLRAGGLAYLRFAFERPGLYRLMFSPPATDQLAQSPFASDPGAQCLAVLHEAIAACRTEGYLPEADPMRMAFVLWSTVHGAASLVLQGRAPIRPGGDPAAEAIAAVDALISFVRTTRRAAPPST